MLTINGKEYELNGKTVAEALAEIGYGFLFPFENLTRNSALP